MQPKLFENTTETVAIEDVILYALGDFQSRGKVLVDRELALNRLQGTFSRAFAKFGIEELPDEQIVEGLKNLGVKVVVVPNYVAKHPFRITIPLETANKGCKAFSPLNNDAA